MPIEVTMPRLSDTMEQGTVVKWNVKEGQKVSTGDVIADIETDKATMELQSFDDGTVASLAVPEGQTVKVGTVIMLLAGQGESAGSAKGGASAGAAKPEKKAAEQGAGFSEKEAVGTATVTKGGMPKSGGSSSGHDASASGNGAGSAGRGAQGGERVFASPLARKMAEEAGVDLNEIKGTGPSGRIVRKDIEAATSGGGAPAAKRESAPSGGAGRVPTAARVPGPAFEPGEPKLQGRTVQLSNMRRTIAKRLVESKTSIPHYQVTVEADMDALLALRQQLNDQLGAQGVKLSVNDFLVRACALAMHQHPYVNSRWLESGGDVSIELLEQVNVGVAIALPEERGGGLVVGTLRGTDRMGLRQISNETKRLAEKARSKGLSIEEMGESTFTMSNLGMFGVEHFTAIINPPNVAILAVGAAVEKPIVRGGQVVVGRRMSMTMSSDHRVVDGAMAAQYLATVKGMLERPATLLV
jgi:pyruvate dehydrogenase E2 component (dihydrolipoamide acetyltransferase)